MADRPYARPSITWTRIIRPGEEVDLDSGDVDYWVRMSHGDRNFEIQPLRKPRNGKYRERILDQRALSAFEGVVEDHEVASHPQKVLARADRTNLIPQEIIVIQQVPERGQIIALVFVANVLIPMLHLCAKYARTMQDVQRLAEVGGIGVDGEHFARPGGAAAVRAGDEDGREIVVAWFGWHT